MWSCAGVYALCIDNTISRFSGKLVDLYLSTYVVSDWHAFGRSVEEFTISVNTVRVRLLTLLPMKTREWQTCSNHSCPKCLVSATAHSHNVALLPVRPYLRVKTLHVLTGNDQQLVRDSIYDYVNVYAQWYVQSNINKMST